MILQELLTTVRDTLTVGRVFGEPYQVDGVTVLPVALVAGGGGGGEGGDTERGEGQGGGFGLAVKPAGVYVIADGDVRWQPAVDVNRLASTVGAVVVVALLTRVRMRKLRGRT